MMLALLLGVAAATHDEDRAREIERINSHPGVLWTAGVNERFKGQPVGAAKSLCGVKPESLDMLKERIASGKIERVEHVLEGVELPDSFDPAEKWPMCAKTITDIRDQSNCGCCWAFGAAEAASDRLCIATKGKVQVPLSAQETCFCAQDDGCDGGMLPTAWEYIQEHGLATGGQYQGTGPFGKGFCNDFSLPHCHHHGPQGSDPYPDENQPGCPKTDESPTCPKSCDADAAAPHNVMSSDKYKFEGSIKSPGSEEAIMHEIMTNGPVEAAFTVYSDFENYVSGIYHATSSEPMGGHAIKVVGWGEEDGTKYWKVQNSWNPYWGEKGYFRIKKGSDECGIESQVVAGAGTWSGHGTSPEVVV